MALVRPGQARFSAWFGGLLLVGLLAVPAVAGDRAGIGFIGYSPDGRYFAFDEFGVQDGSGFAYANLYVLDLKADQWVKGTPIRVRLEDEASTVAAARADASGRARTILQQLQIDEPVEIMALNGDGAPGNDTAALHFGKPGYGTAPSEQSYELSLSKVEADLAQQECADWSASGVTGFALSLSVDGQTREVYRDQAVPESRGCPEGYRLHSVVAPFDSYAEPGPGLVPATVAIVSVYAMGFEGPDRRFIAVPLGF